MASFCDFSLRFRSPFRYYLSILAAVKNEALYIAEWVEFHILIGVEHFWLVDNNSTDNLHDVLTPYLSQRIITLRYWPKPYEQVKAYNAILPEMKSLTFWAAVIDVDEFFVATGGQSVLELLRSRENSPGITVFLIFFGANGKQKRECGLVIEIFQNHTTLEHNRKRLPKMIVNPRAVKHMHVHHALYTGATRATNLCDGRVRLCYEGMRLNHYFTKSLEEWVLKVSRGRFSDTMFYSTSFLHEFPDKEHDSFIDWAIPLVKRNLKRRLRWLCDADRQIGITRSSH